MSNTKDNWRELAELLGLPTDAPPPPEATAAPTPVAEPFPPATSVLPSEECRDTIADERIAEMSLADEPEPMEPLTAEAPDEAEVSPPSEEEPRRGRRRGRRGRRRDRDDAPEDAPKDAAEGKGEEPRRRPEPEVAKPAAVADDDGEQDDFSQDAWADWNVPNWQELIDGLHRPDR